MVGQDGEWTQVTRKGGRLHHVPAQTNGGAESLGNGIRPNPNPELTADQLYTYHSRITTDCQTTGWWEQFCPILESALNKPNCPVITKAVCLGNGPYEPQNGSATARRTAHTQTAAFCLIVQHLEYRGGQKIKCYVQEPRLTQADKSFCAMLGLQAIDSPAGFAMVDGETLLFGIHLELDIYNQALKTLPGIYIGACLQEWEKVVDHAPGAEDPLAAFSKMDADYVKYGFPDLDYMFSSTVMYCREG